MLINEVNGDSEMKKTTEINYLDEAKYAIGDWEITFENHAEKQCLIQELGNSCGLDSDLLYEAILKTLEVK